MALFPAARSSEYNFAWNPPLHSHSAQVKSVFRLGFAGPWSIRSVPPSDRFVYPPDQFCGLRDKSKKMLKMQERWLMSGAFLSKVESRM
jgi:hypothetical protein